MGNATREAGSTFLGEASYSILFRDGPLPMWVFDPTTLRFLDVNEAAVRHYGYAREEFLAMTLEDVRPPEAVPALHKQLAKIPPGAGIPTVSTGIRHRKKDGTVIEVEVVSEEVAGIGGAARLAIIRDVTAERAAEHGAMEGNTRFRALLETAMDAVLIADDSGRFMDANPAACSLLGRTRDAVLSIGFTNLAPSSGQGGEVLKIWRDFRLQGRARGELSIRHTDGSTRRVEYLARGDMLPGRHLMVFRDLTERKAMQRRLVESERLATMAQLASFVAHQINTPLTSIALLTANIARRVEDPEVKDRLGQIDEQRRIAASIISNLLRFAKFSKVDIVETDLRNVIEDAVSDLAPYRKEGVSLVLDLGAEPFLARVDPVLMREVFVNLVKNALEATTEGTVTVQRDPRFFYPAVSVGDTGAGMPPEVFSRLFQPFFTTKGRGGTGLGLALSRSLVVAQGGEIVAHSEPGRGSKFTILLPWSRPG
jgi:PAS domain S-box-containing protein